MSGPPYVYSMLSVAAEAPRNTLVCAWAVVAECSVPRPTRGTDMVCNMTLMDPSTSDSPALAAGIELLCFGPHSEQLPHVHRPGDIIRLHRVKVDRYNDRTQLVGKVGYRGFAFCLFESEGPVLPYQTSSPHYHYDEREQGLLAALRHYLATVNRQHLGGSTVFLRRIKDVRPTEFFDAICRVVAADNSHPDWRMLFVWDGSDALPFPKSYDTRLSEDVPDAQRLQQLRPFSVPLQEAPGPQDIPLLGTALPLLLPKHGRVEHPALGSWVKFRNLGARVVEGQLQAYFHRSSRWTPWQQEHHPQQQFLTEYQERLAANLTAGWAPDPCTCSSDLLAVCSDREQPYSTLRQVLLDTLAAQPRRYRVLVRLVDYSPREPADMCHPAGDCGLPGPSRPSSSTWVYTLRLLVEDATGALDLILFGPDAEHFLHDMPAHDLRTDAAAAAALEQRLQQLLGQGCQRDGGPWMELSIKSYFLDPARPWQTRQYRLQRSTLQLPAQQ